MANKCCSCSRFLSCLSCFSRGNDPDVQGTTSSDVPAVMEIPSVGSSSPAIEEGNVDVDLDALIERISNLLEQMKEGTKSPQIETKTAQHYLPITSKGFIKLKEFLSETANFVKDIVPGDAIKTVASGILEGMGMAHLATAGLVVVASILERVDDVSANKTECLRLLSEMIFLAKLVKQFKERSQLKETMHAVIREATELVVESSIKCLAQMKSSKFSKFLEEPINKEGEREFVAKIELCNSVADSIPGELQGESGIPSAKARQEEYMTSTSSSAPNV